MSPTFLRIGEKSPYRQLVGVGGVGAGIFFQLEGDQTLGRNESRLGRLLDVRDYCKLHIVIDSIAKLLGTRSPEPSFRIVPVAKVGTDGTGQRVTREMVDAGIDTSHVVSVPGTPTLFSVCFQYPDGSGGNITTNNSAAGLLSDADIDAASDLLRAGARYGIALSVPEVPLGVRRYFLEVASRWGAFRAASFAAAEVKAARESSMFDMLDLVSLNQGEAEQFVGSRLVSGAEESFIRTCQDTLRRHYPGLNFVVTLGDGGAYGVTAEAVHFSPAPKVTVASTAGAGDSLLGGIIAALAAGIPFLPHHCDLNRSRKAQLESALELGVLLGSYKCLSHHTIHPDISLDSLLEFATAAGVTCAPGLADSFLTHETVRHVSPVPQAG